MSYLKIKNVFFLAVLTLWLGSFATSAQAQAACGKVTIAEMTWQSAALLAHFDSRILSAGYGCEIELVPGDTMPTSTSMIEKGEPDIAPELWTNALGPILDPAVAEGRIAKAGESIRGGAVEGWWVPKFAVDANPELATIEGVRKNAKLFTHPEDPDKGAVYGCPAGWNCQITTGQLYKAFDMDSAGFELINPGSGAGLAAAMASSYNKGEPWIGFYWGPTAVLGRFDMVLVDMGEHDPVEWERCIGLTPDCPDPKRMGYAPAIAEIYVSSKIKDNEIVMQYLGKRGMTSAQLSEILTWAEDHQASPEETAEYLLNERSDLWKPMVSEEAAAKIEASLL